MLNLRKGVEGGVAEERRWVDSFVTADCSGRGALRHRERPRVKGHPPEMRGGEKEGLRGGGKRRGHRGGGTTLRLGS